VSARPSAIPIAVLASGRGSNFDAIHDAISRGELDARIVALVSDQPGAPALAKAEAAGIRPLLVPLPDKSEAASVEARRALHDGRVLEALATLPEKPRFLVMAGYMRVITARLLEAFRSERGYARIVNVHPSLLPAFPGAGSYARAFDHGAKLSGVSVHLVELDVDAGPICAQEAFAIDDCASAEEVERRGIAVEHRLYPRTLSWVLPENFAINPVKGRFCVRPN
jgi:phosphoribosylglycinamide formyltransferase-1